MSSTAPSSTIGTTNTSPGDKSLDYSDLIEKGFLPPSEPISQEWFIKQYGKRVKKEGSVDKEKMKELLALIPAASSGNMPAPQSTVDDGANTSYIGYQFNSETKQSLPALFAISDGQRVTIKNNKESEVLYSILNRIEKQFRQRERMENSKSSPGDSDVWDCAPSEN